MIWLRALSFMVAVQLTVLGVVPWLLVDFGPRLPIGRNSFGYSLLLALSYNVFVRYYEEPRLRRVFGQSYLDYCAAVPRWWPRLTPWSNDL